MKLFHFHHRTRHLRKRPVHVLESSLLLHVLGRSLVDVFIPILLLQRGYSLGDVLWYCVLFMAIDIPLNFVADWMIRRIGAIRTTMLGTIASIAFLTLLGRLGPHSWTMLATLAALAAIYDGLYWVGHLYLFSQSEQEGDDAHSDTGALYAIRIIGGMMGPIVGAGLLVFENRTLLIATSVTFLLLSLIPLFGLHVPGDIPAARKRTPFREFFSDARERYNYGGLLLYSLNDPAEAVLFPLFIYMTYKTIESVALLAVIVALASAGLSYAAGKFSRFHPKSMIAVGALLIALTWIVRIAVPHPTVYYGSLLIMGFLSLITTIPMEGGVLGRAKEIEPLSAMTYRNTSTMAPQVFFFLALALLVNVFKIGFFTAMASMFVLAAISAFILMRNRGFSGPRHADLARP